MTAALRAISRRVAPARAAAATDQPTCPATATERASHAVPETLESSLQLSEAVLADIGVAMGPVIASIHEKRDQFRIQIQKGGALERKPKLRTSSVEAT